MTSTQQVLYRNTNATNIASMRHRHRRPPPAHTLTSYPPIHVADLSSPPARQPSRPGLPIPQLPPPRRRQRPHLRPVLLSSHDARFQSEPTWKHYCYVNYNYLPYGCKHNSAPSYPFSHSLTFRPAGPPLYPADSPPAAATGSSPLPPPAESPIRRIFAGSHIPPDRSRRAQLRQLDIGYTIWYSNHMV